ncbi:MAG: hypothetical protein WCL18_06040 [bacterium]
MRLAKKHLSLLYPLLWELSYCEVYLASLGMEDMTEMTLEETLALLVVA